MNVAFTYFPRLTDAGGRRVRTTWPKLLERLRAPRVVASKEDAPGLSLATFRGDRRSLANVEFVYAIGLDLDALDAVSIFVDRKPGEVIEATGWDGLLVRFGAVDSFLHTTWSSTSDAPRARVFIRLSRPVTADEYRRVYAFVAGVAERGGLVIDRKASDPSRFWFLPSAPLGGRFHWSVGDGRAIDVDGALEVVPPPAPPAPPTPIKPPSGDAGDVEGRAAAYLARCEPAIQGSGGDDCTFITCQRIVRGFALDEATAYRLLCAWNATCQPPWTERGLRRKIREAATRGTFPIGSLRDRPMRRAS